MHVMPLVLSFALVFAFFAFWFSLSLYFNHRSSLAAFPKTFFRGKNSPSNVQVENVKVFWLALSVSLPLSMCTYIYDAMCAYKHHLVAHFQSLCVVLSYFHEKLLSLPLAKQSAENA